MITPVVLFNAKCVVFSKAIYSSELSATPSSASVAVIWSTDVPIGVLSEVDLLYKDFPKTGLLSFTSRTVTVTTASGFDTILGFVVSLASISKL